MHIKNPTDKDWEQNSQSSESISLLQINVTRSQYKYSHTEEKRSSKKWVRKPSAVVNLLRWVATETQGAKPASLCIFERKITGTIY